MSSIDSSSAEAAGRRATHAGSTKTWQVAQVMQPPQSAAMPSMPAPVAAFINDWPVRPTTGVPYSTHAQYIAVPATVVRRYRSGLIVNRTGGDVLRLLPPYVITSAQIARGLDILRDVLRAI